MQESRLEPLRGKGFRASDLIACGDKLLIVGYNDYQVVLAQILEKVDEMAPTCRIKRRSGLVKQHHLWVFEEHADDGDLLFLLLTTQHDVHQ